MRVCIDIRHSLKATSTGLGKFTVTLIEAINSGFYGERVDLVLYYRKKMFDVKKTPPRFSRVSVSYFNGRRGKMPDADIYISSGWDFVPPPGKKFILIVHDLIPISASSFASEQARNNLFNQLPQSLERADAVVAISKNTRDDLLKFYPQAKPKTHLIYNAISSIYRQPMSEKEKKKTLKRLKIKDDYILFVSSIEPRKNLISLLKAFAKIEAEFPDLKLVVAGKKVKSYKQIDDFWANYPAKDKIIFLGYVDDKDLVNLYRCAKVFIYPSFYEGFGLPVVEAFACGVPVITSDISAMTEIVGDSAYLVDPYCNENIVEGVNKIMKDIDYRNQLVVSASKKADNFSLTNMGRAYVKLFRKILGRKKVGQE